jgi:mevalonate kinase
MTSYDFQTTAYAKWILAGEHAVVRGHGALVFPAKEYSLCLTYYATKTALSVRFTGSAKEEIQSLFWTVLKQSLLEFNQVIEDMQGHFHIDANIPVGVGLGTSAAVCVVVSRWCVFQKWLDPKELYKTAKTLENLFHKKSSGVDIIGVSSDSGVYFKDGEFSPLQSTWQPHWQLSSCGELGSTAYCIERVQSLWAKDPKLAENIDKQMDNSVNQAKLALESQDPNRFHLLVQAIQMARECFHQWNLVTDPLENHMQHLLRQGAIAVKPTGSGGGGHVLSLWAEENALRENLEKSYRK